MRLPYTCCHVANVVRYIANRREVEKINPSTASNPTNLGPGCIPNAKQAPPRLEGPSLSAGAHAVQPDYNQTKVRIATSLRDYLTPLNEGGNVRSCRGNTAQAWQRSCDVAATICDTVASWRPETSMLFVSKYLLTYLKCSSINAACTRTNLRIYIPQVDSNICSGSRGI